MKTQGKIESAFKSRLASIIPLPALILLVMFMIKGGTVPDDRGCLRCHTGIEPFARGKMMEKIEARGKRFGDPSGCTVCHGGSPMAGTAAEAHSGAAARLSQDSGPQNFYRNPGALAAAPFTCGQCHEGYARRVLKSLSSHQTADIHRNLCLYALRKRAGSGSAAAGATSHGEGEESIQPNATTGVAAAAREMPAGPGKEAARGVLQRFGRYALLDEDGPRPVVGTPAYRDLMTGRASNPTLFTDRISAPPRLDPAAVADWQGNADEWNKRCGVCHSFEAMAAPPEPHGTGCAACHVPYRRGGTYLGSDPTIDKTRPGKLLLHRLQGSGNTRIALPAGPGATPADEAAYHGVAADNCFVCHNDVRQETLNPIGSVMSHYGGLHRNQMGGTLSCQDCHTTVDMHGDGNIPVTTMAQIEIRCEDCHGTVTRAPWELPLGYDGMPGEDDNGPARGLSDAPLDLAGARYPAADGLLLTSKGNPFGNVVKNGDEVVLYSAAGDKFLVPVLQAIQQNGTWQSPLSRQVKSETAVHNNKMACMTCHTDQVRPPCLGCHVSQAGLMLE